MLYNFDPIGLIYLPEIKYRRILNQAFGPGGWAIMPRGETLNFQVRTHCNTFAVHVMLVYILTTSTGESCPQCQETEGAQLITREYAL